MPNELNSLQGTHGFCFNFDYKEMINRLKTKFQDFTKKLMSFLQFYLSNRKFVSNFFKI